MPDKKVDVHALFCASSVLLAVCLRRIGTPSGILDRYTILSGLLALAAALLQGALYLADHRLPNTRALDLDGGIAGPLDARAGLRELAADHRKQPGTAAPDRRIPADGRRSSRRHRGLAPLGADSRRAENCVAGMLRESKVAACHH